MLIPNIPNNSVTDEIREIVEIAERLDGVKNFVFNEPATEEELQFTEHEIGCTLPVEIRDFYKFSNGITLNGFTADFLCLKEIANLFSAKKSPDFPKNYIIIAEIIGDGEVLCFSKENNNFIRYFNGEKLTFNTFKEFLNSIIIFIKELNDDYFDK